MSGLPNGAFLTSINGKQCTAIPKRAPPEPSKAPPDDKPPATTEPPKTSPPDDKPPGPPESNPGRGGNPPGQGKGPEKPPPGQSKGPPSNPPGQPDQNTTKTSSPPTTKSDPPPETSSPTSAPEPPTTSQPPLPPPAPPSSSSPTSESSTSTPEPPPPQLTTSITTAPAESVAPAPTTSSPSSSEKPTAPLPIGPSSESESAVPTLPSSIPPSIAPPASASVVPSVPLSLDTSAPPPFPTTADPERTTTEANGLITTIGVDTTQPSSQPDREGTSGADSQAGTGLLQGSNGSPSKGVIIGSTVGAAAFIGLIALFLWLFRKRSLKKRRSTLLTPLTMPQNMEKAGVYEFDSGSVGPTPRSEKIAAAVSNNFKAFGKVFGHGNGPINMNSGNTQFMADAGSQGPGAMAAGTAGVLSTKDRYRDWWTRLGEDAKFNWRVRHEQFGATSRYPNLASSDNKQDFRALIDVSEQEAQRRRDSRSSHGSANSRDHFLAGLNVDLNNASATDPFSDANAAPAEPRRSYHNRINSLTFDTTSIQLPPFSVHPPSSYVAEVQRSRGRTMSGGGSSRPGSTASNRRSAYRSGQSFDSQAARRNKFRSDPFDLEIENRTLPTDSDLAQMPTLKPDMAAAGPPPSYRGVASSKYPSGVSSVSSASSYRTVSVKSVNTGDWSDPGPDVGPGVSRRGDSSVPSGGDKKGGRGIGMAM